MQNTVVTDTKKWDTVVNIEGVTKYFDQNRPVSMFRREKHRIYALKDVSFTLQKAKFACYSRCFLTSYFCIPVPYNEKDIFFGC